MDKKYNEELQFIRDSRLPESQKEKLEAIVRGERLADLWRDLIAKHVFSPDLHPERMEFILQHTMGDPDMQVVSSATNEPALKNIYSKKTIFDIPAWLNDRKLADLEIQMEPQEYIFNRTDIYSSNMLLLQYSVEPGQPKDERDYENVQDSIIIVLMVKSPNIFKDYRSDRYIHRFIKARADTGLEVRKLKQMAFVQLDKALEMYISGEYNEDEDVDLLKLFAMMADINNKKIIEEAAGNSFLGDIRSDVYQFTRSPEVQHMLTIQDLDMLDYNTNIHIARREGREEGREEGEAKIVALNKWLYSQGRDADVRKGTEDPAYLKSLLEEYDTSTENDKN